MPLDKNQQADLDALSSLALRLNRVIESRLGRSCAVFVVSFFLVWLVATTAGFSGILFAIALASFGALADGLLIPRPNAKSQAIADFGRSVSIVVAAGGIILLMALVFREIVRYAF